jgi:hypothetical protein
MRPSEINHSDPSEHFIDLSNGEIVAGKLALKGYLMDAGPEADIQNIGVLLRTKISKESLGQEYERLDTSDWDEKQFIAFGKWIAKLVTPPSPGRRIKSLNKDVLRNAHLLGIGPSEYTFEREFGNYSNFYAMLNVKNLHKRNYFDDWDIEDLIKYAKKVGGERRPTRADFDHAAGNAYPSARYIKERFKLTGGFETLLSLAGYCVVERWTREDYVDWGVHLMIANDVMVPSQDAADFLSKKTWGPSAKTVSTKFGSFKIFQTEVIKAYGKEVRDQTVAKAEKVDQIQKDIDTGNLPEVLLAGEDNKPLDLSSDEMITRYAKLKVLQALNLPITMERITSVILEPILSSFSSAIRKTHPGITPADIEYTALVNGYFDDIWPRERDLDRLRLGEDFVVFRRERDLKRVGRRVLQRS